MQVYPETHVVAPVQPVPPPKSVSTTLCQIFKERPYIGHKQSVGQKRQWRARCSRLWRTSLLIWNSTNQKCMKNGLRWRPRKTNAWDLSRHAHAKELKRHFTSDRTWKVYTTHQTTDRRGREGHTLTLKNYSSNRGSWHLTGTWALAQSIRLGLDYITLHICGSFYY